VADLTQRLALFDLDNTLLDRDAVAVADAVEILLRTADVPGVG